MVRGRSSVADPVLLSCSPVLTTTLKLRRENERLARRSPTWKNGWPEGAGLTAMKVRAVIALKADYRWAVLLQVAGLARLFYHRARLAEPDPLADLEAAVTEVCTNSRGRYGHRCVHAVLVAARWTPRRRPSSSSCGSSS